VAQVGKASSLRQELGVDGQGGPAHVHVACETAPTHLTIIEGKNATAERTAWFSAPLTSATCYPIRAVPEPPFAHPSDHAPRGPRIRDKLKKVGAVEVFVARVGDAGAQPVTCLRLLHDWLPPDSSDEDAAGAGEEGDGGEDEEGPEGEGGDDEEEGGGGGGGGGERDEAFVECSMSQAVLDAVCEVGLGDGGRWPVRFAGGRPGELAAQHRAGLWHGPADAAAPWPTSLA
jgi:hypothetical protein